MSWASELLVEARRIGVYGNGNTNEDWALFRAYYLDTESEHTGWFVFASEIEYNNILTNDIDKKYMMTAAREKARKNSPRHIQITTIELADTGEIQPLENNYMGLTT